MNKRGEFNIPGYIIAMLTGSLAIGVLMIFVVNLGGTYDTTGLDESNLNRYNIMGNLSADIQTASQQVDEVTVDPDFFDFLSGMFNKLLSPLKFTYRTFVYGGKIIGFIVVDLKLPSIFIDYFVSVLTVLVVIAIVMFKLLLGRR